MVKGRFGSAIASVGDLDGDGNEDLVVGSPYENDGQGAVRVFYGNNNLNKISGKNVKFRNTSYFRGDFYRPNWNLNHHWNWY